MTKKENYVRIYFNEDFTARIEKEKSAFCLRCNEDEKGITHLAIMKRTSGNSGWAKIKSSSVQELGELESVFDEMVGAIINSETETLKDTLDKIFPKAVIKKKIPCPLTEEGKIKK